MQQKKGFSDLLLYDHMVAPGVMRLKDGGYMVGFQFHGPDTESATKAELDALSAALSAAIKQLDGGWMLHIDTSRKQAEGYPGGQFTELTNALVDLERKAQFEQEGNHYETISTLWITWLPPRVEQSKFRKVLELLTGEVNESEAAVEERHVEMLETRVKFVIDRVSHYLTMRRLTLNVDGTCDMMRALNYIVNERWHPVKVPPVPAYLDCLLARDALNGEALLYDNQYMATISIVGYPFESVPGILREMERIPLEMRWSNRFIVQEYRDTVAHLKMVRKKWEQKTRPFWATILRMESNAPVDLDALSMCEDTEIALSEAHTGLIAFGNHTSTVLLRRNTLEEIDRDTREVVKIFERAGFNVQVERRNAMEAFLGSLPGHGYQNVRKPMINSINYADLAGITSDWTGAEFCPCPYYPPKSPALVQAASMGTTPFRLNLHVGDVGHTLIVGPTGAGKSTLLGLLASQFDRYERNQLFVFDMGFSMYPLTKANFNAKHYDLGGETSPTLCPLAEIDNQADREWAANWLEGLCLLSLRKQDASIMPRQRQLIREALDTLAESTTSSEQRTLTHFATTVQDEDIRLYLDPYLVKRDGVTGAAMLDGMSDSVQFQRMTVFDIENLWGYGQAIAAPVLTYLFRQIEKRLDGRPSMLIIDEGWLSLDTPMFASKIKEWLKTWRRKVCHVVLSTQSPTDLAHSSIRDVIIESCPTRILLPNREARTESVGELYRHLLQLNERQVELIEKGAYKRDYYYVSPVGRRLFQLGLGPLALAFVGHTGKEDIQKVRDLEAAHGERWPVAWLSQLGMAEWAARFEEELDALLEEERRKTA